MPTSTQVEPRSERKRRDILEAAKARFMVEGYASTGMEVVARDAGVSTATLYSYFPSKADLFQNVIEDAAESFGAVLMQATQIEGDGAARLRSFAVAYAGFMNDPFTRAMFCLVTAERRRFEGLALSFYHRIRTAFGGGLIAILHSLEMEGAVGFEKASWAAGQFLGMIEHPTFLAPLLSGEAVLVNRPLESICEEAVATFMARYGTRA